MVEAGGIEPPSASDPRLGATFLACALSKVCKLPQTKSGKPFPQFISVEALKKSAFNLGR